MRALVVYESMFGNTERLAQAVGEELAAVGTVQVMNVDDAPRTLDGIDLLVVGAPTHAFGLSRPQTRVDAASRWDTDPVTRGTGMRDWLELVSPASAEMTAVAFGTRMRKPRWLTGSAARSATRLLRRAGFAVDAPEDFFVTGMLGPLFDGEIARAHAWAHDLVGVVPAVG